jgi:hypothetical protein
LFQTENTTERAKNNKLLPTSANIIYIYDSVYPSDQ